MARTDPSIAFRAGWTRIVMAVFGIVLMPIVFPALSQHAVVFWAYLVLSLAIQVAIKKQIGGNVRVLLGGAMDLAVLTYFVNRLGSGTTPIVSMYLLIGVMNALAVGLRQAQIIAGLGFLAYVAVILLEQRGAIPYAPDPPPWGAPMPGPAGALSIAILTGALMFISTSIVGTLVEVVRGRERELTRANALLEELSQKDPLTQLYNRRHLVSRIEHELARVKRGHPMALLMIDLDGFKRVNDERGHLHGDELLAVVATALQGSTRATDVAGRYGGDEFIVVLTDTEVEPARAVSDRLVKNIAEAARRQEADHPVTASVGLAVARHDDRVATIIRRADALCYEAKQAGGDRVEVEA